MALAERQPAWLLDGLPGGRPNSPLKNAVVEIFNLARCGAKLRTKAQNNDLRRHFGIASMRWRSPSNTSTRC